MKDGRMSIRISSENKERLKKEADDLGIDVTAVINMAIKEFFNTRNMSNAITDAIKKDPTSTLSRLLQNYQQMKFDNDTIDWSDNDLQKK